MNVAKIRIMKFGKHAIVYECLETKEEFIGTSIIYENDNFQIASVNGQAISKHTIYLHGVDGEDNSCDVATLDTEKERDELFKNILQACKECNEKYSTENNEYLTYEEVRKALLEGKKLTHKNWISHEYIYFDNDSFCVRDEKDTMFELDDIENSLELFNKSTFSYDEKTGIIEF